LVVASVLKTQMHAEAMPQKAVEKAFEFVCGMRMTDFNPNRAKNNS
jgi:hypothetical protein